MIYIAPTSGAFVSGSLGGAKTGLKTVSLDADDDPSAGLAHAATVSHERKAAARGVLRVGVRRVKTIRRRALSLGGGSLLFKPGDNRRSAIRLNARRSAAADSLAVLKQNCATSRHSVRSACARQNKVVPRIRINSFFSLYWYFAAGAPETRYNLNCICQAGTIGPELP